MPPPSDAYLVFHDQPLTNFTSDHLKLFETLRVYHTKVAISTISSQTNKETDSVGYFGGHPYGHSFSFDFPSPWEITEYILKIWVIIYVAVGTYSAFRSCKKIYRAAKQLADSADQAKAQRVEEVEDVQSKCSHECPHKERKKCRKSRK